MWHNSATVPDVITAIWPGMVPWSYIIAILQWGENISNELWWFIKEFDYVTCLQYDEMFNKLRYSVSTFPIIPNARHCFE